MAVLAAPSLQHLDAEVSDAIDAFPIPHLCRFICDTDNRFILVHLDFSEFHLKVTAKTRSQFVHTKPFRIVIPESISFEEIGNRLSEPLATVEEVVVGWYITSGRCQIQWRKFFDHVQQVKLVNLPSQVALGVARSFQRDGQEPAMDVLPALERVDVDMKQWRYSPPGSDIGSSQYRVTVTDAFEPLIAAREKVGAP